VPTSSATGPARQRRIPSQAHGDNQGWPKCSMPPKVGRTVLLLGRRSLQHGESHFSSTQVGWCSPAGPKALARQMDRQSMPVESVVPRSPDQAPAGQPSVVRSAPDLGRLSPMYDKVSVGVCSRVVPGRHDATVLGLGRVPGRGDVRVLTADDDHGFADHWLRPLRVVPGEMSEQRVVLDRVRSGRG